MHQVEYPTMTYGFIKIYELWIKISKFSSGGQSFCMCSDVNRLEGVFFKRLTPTALENKKKKRQTFTKDQSLCWQSKTMSAMTVNVTLEVYIQDVPLSAQVNVQPNWLYTTAMKRDLSMHSNEVKGSSPANEQRASKGGSHEASSNPDHITCDRSFISYPFGSQQLRRHNTDATGPADLLCIAGSKHSKKKQLSNISNCLH